MSPQTSIISLLILLASLISSNASYIVEPLHQTNANYYYPVHNVKFIKRKHEHFGVTTRANRDTLFSSRPRGIVSVDDYGAKADGRDDSEVTLTNI